MNKSGVTKLLIDDYYIGMPIPLFLVPILAGLIAQGMKPWLNKRLYVSMGKGNRKLPRYGGMPSAHSAFAFSLATTIGVVDGFLSSNFTIAVAFLIFILDDALRMRMFLGHYGRALKILTKRLPKEQRQGLPYIEARLGHTPKEVVAGAILGIFVTLVIVWLIGIS